MEQCHVIQLSFRQDPGPLCSCPGLLWCALTTLSLVVHFVSDTPLNPKAIAGRGRRVRYQRNRTDLKTNTAGCTNAFTLAFAIHALPIQKSTRASSSFSLNPEGLTHSIP